MSIQNIKGTFKLIAIVLLLFNLTSVCNAFQKPKEVKLSSIYKELISTKKTSLSFEKIFILDDILERQLAGDSLYFIEALEAILNLPVPLDSSGIITNVTELSFINVSSTNLNFSDLNIEEFIIDNGEFENLNFYSSNFSYYSIDRSKVSKEILYDKVNFDLYRDYGNNYKKSQMIECEFSSFFQTGSTVITGEYWISDSRFKKGAYIAPVFDGNFTDFYLSENTFDPIESALKIQHPELIPENFIPRTQLRLNLFGELNQMVVEGNDFLSNEADQIIYIEGDFDYMSVTGNLFESRFYPACTVAKKFSFLENDITADLIFTDLILQGKNNDLYWNEIQGFKFAATMPVETILTENLDYFGINLSQKEAVFTQTSDIIFIPYRGDQDLDFENEGLFQGLISSYYRIYKVFKENGQIDDANQIYVEMKDVQLRQLKYNYKTYGGLENWIQWRLNSLLRFYTDYGTNPSRAIRISIFVVLLFSVFYFFFPSEWDTKSKKQMLGDYKLLIEKNEHGYFKPFFKLSLGFAKSLINALTLSLNSFVTLGFGTIPTTGLARYVCIIQGFIGWFLLSVFTASLINQVLF